jgi:hypothetical protein
MRTTRNGVTDTALLSLALSTRVMVGGAPEIVLAEMRRVDADLVAASKRVRAQSKSPARGEKVVRRTSRGHRTPPTF